MRPSKQLLTFLLIWSVLALIVFILRLSVSLSVVEFFVSLWWWGLYAFGAVVFYDGLRHRSFSQLSVCRELPRSMALGVNANVSIELNNPYNFPITVSLVDLYPSSITVESLPLQFRLGARASQALIYSVLPLVRGEAIFGETCLRVSARWGFWQKRVYLGLEQSVKVYPNFAPMAQFASLGLEHQIARLGVHLQQRRGEGSDFHQLREFREGDAMRQIDWKATARFRKPISRDYQDERDQDIVFLLDCGRRLRSKDDQISHFDHALNAVLLTSYVALGQGDAVGLMSFAGAPRWMSPIKGPIRINSILNQLYDLQCTTQTSDYLQAAEQFMGRYNKRSLLVMVTNVQTSDMDDLLSAVQLLSKKHVVLIASLRDGFLDTVLEESITSFSGALSYCGVSELMSERLTLRKKLQRLGVIVTDSLPQRLHIDLVNEYVRVKRSGRL